MLEGAGEEPAFNPVDARLLQSRILRGETRFSDYRQVVESRAPASAGTVQPTAENE